MRLPGAASSLRPRQRVQSATRRSALPRATPPRIRAWSVRLVRLIALALLLAASAAAQTLPGLPGAGQEEAAPPLQRTLSVESSAATDRAIRKRLAGIYAEVGGLEGIEVEVAAGVVTLRGEVLSSAARAKAEGIARQLQDVVDVENELEEVRDLARRLRPAIEHLRERALGLVGWLPLLGVALLAFVLFLVLARLITSWEWPFRRLASNPFARDLLRQAVRSLIVLAGIVFALEILDATALVAALAGVAGLVGLALGFAFRDLAENYIASVLLSMRQPFLPNDHVRVEGQEGHVLRLTSRATLLLTLDGNHVRIPNATVFKGILINYTRNPRRRFEFQLGVAPETDLSTALSRGLEVLATMEGVLDEPQPAAWIHTLGDSTVVLLFLGWVDQREVDFAKARSEAIRRVKEDFDAAGIGMPEPGVRVLRAAETEPQAVAGARTAPSEAAPAPDMAPEKHIEREVEEERAEAGDADLLDPEARLE